MKTSQRITSIFLVLLLLVSSVPFAFAQTNMAPTFDETQTSVSGTNAIGKMLASETVIPKSEGDEDYAVTDLIMNETKATVFVKNKTACYLVVAAYDEDTTKMLSSNYEMLKANAESATLELENMQAENIIVKAFLLDTNYKALCKSYVFQGYSQAYKDFMEQDIFDFEENRVLNLDEEIDKNFLVFGDHVITVSQNGTNNTLLLADYDNNIYTFGNADSELTALKAGDVFYWGTDDFSEVIIASVVSVAQNEDGSATIRGETASMEEAFDFVKIDAEPVGSEFVLDESTVGEGITPIASGSRANAALRKAIDVDVTKNLSKEYSINKTFQNKENTASVNINGSAKFALDAEMKIYVSKKYKEVSFHVKPSIRLDFSISGEAETYLQFGDFCATPVPGLFINIKPSLHFEVSGSVSTGASVSMDLGFGYDSTNGLNNQSTKPEVEFDGVDAEVSLYIGIDLKPNAYFVWDDLAYVELTTECGLVATGRMAWGKQEDIIKHICTNCIDGDLKCSVKMAVDLEFFKGTRFEEVFKDDLWTKMFDVCDFYWSLTYRKFGLGECPYHLAKVDFLVLDEDSVEPISGATISTGVTDAIAIKYNNNTADVTTDAEGKATYFFPVGSFEPQISMTDYHTKKTDEITVDYDKESNAYFVNHSALQVTVETRLKVSNIIASGECGIDARWELDKDGTLTVSGTGDMYNYTSTTLPWKDYKKVITNLIVENGIQCVGDYDFYELTALETFELPNTILEIGRCSFYKCSKLKTCIIPSGVTYINESAFENCSSLETLSVSNTVKTICDRAFRACNLLQVDLGQSVETIGGSFGGNSFTEFSIPDSVKSLGSSVLSGCPNLTYINIGKGITTIPSYFISNSPNVKKIIIPNNVTEFPAYSFYDCTGLRTMYIGNGLKTIAASTYNKAFYNCDNLREIYYSGSEDEWNEIKGSDWFVLKNATKYYNYPLPSSYSKAPKRTVTVVETIAKTDAVSGMEYVLLAVKDSNLKTLLAPDNLLYIDQQTAESSTVTFSYVSRETTDGMTAEIYGKSAPHTHSYTETVTQTPTCTEPGEKIFTCVCGDTYTESIPATGHAWGEWVTVKEATETEEGLMERTCANDPTHKETKPIDKLEPSSQPDPEPEQNRCPWCGGQHEGFFQKIIGFFHNIFAKLFGAKY